MAKKKKGQLVTTQRIVWIIVGLLTTFVLILASRILINIQDYFP